MALRNLISEYLVLPCSDLLNRQDVFRQLHFLKRSARWDERKMAQYEDNLFRSLIQHIATHVPYYRDWFASQGYSPHDFKTLSDIGHLPIVSKSIMREEGIDRFLADNIPPRQKMEAHSSGSTGEPFTYYISRKAYSINTAAKLRTWYDAGFRLGDSYVKLTSSPRHSRIKELQDLLSNGQCVTFNSLEDEKMEDILQLFEKKKPSVIRTHPNTIYYLALYRQRHPERFHHSPNIIFTTTSNLPDGFRKTISEVFGCDIVDAYSCEGVPNTAENRLHDGYHVSREYGHIEVLDDSNRKVSDGIGHVVGTDFWNYAMPFVRYDSLDLVQMHQGKIARILGRKCELIETPNGHRYTGQVIEDYFIYQTDNSVQAFQAVYRHKAGQLMFRIIVNSQYTPAIEKRIIEYWQNETGLPVAIQTVDYIPLMHNNKYLTVIHEDTD